MEITVEELNILLQREFERGKSSNQTITYIPNTNFDYQNIQSIIPEPCKSCPNHPSNGGNGICDCVLGDNVTYSINTKKKD